MYQSKMFVLFNLHSLIIINIHVCASQILSYSDDHGNEPAFVPRVVNGWAAQLGDVPYQLAFKIQPPKVKIPLYVTYCGGTIIAPNKVVSAAHCFEEPTTGCPKCWKSGEVSKRLLNKVFAVAGNLANQDFYSGPSTSNGQWRRLESMYLAKLYNFPNNDISVGFTEQPFEFNNNVDSIPYASRFRDYVGTCLVSGYGMISSKEHGEILLLAHLNTLANSWCSRIHRRNMRKFICTSSVVSDVNHGDSGGPLVCLGINDQSNKGKGVLVGVVSGNRLQAGSFFTRVSSFKKLLDSNRGFDNSANMVLIGLLYVGILLF